MFFGLDPVVIALRIPILLIVITVHEFAHARMAYHFGDSTAHSQGRMNLNPISHLDPIGSLMILLVGFGWAKPVPINPYRFSQYRSGLRWVSFAGPLSNLVLAFVCLLVFTYLSSLGLISFGGLPFQFFQQLIIINIYLALFNLVPIPPLDGSKILMSFLPDSHLGIYQQLERYGPIILLMFIFLGAFRIIIFPLANVILQFYSLIISLLPGV